MKSYPPIYDQFQQDIEAIVKILKGFMDTQSVETFSSGDLETSRKILNTWRDSLKMVEATLSTMQSKWANGSKFVSQMMQGVGLYRSLLENFLEWNQLTRTFETDNPKHLEKLGEFAEKNRVLSSNADTKFAEANEALKAIAGIDMFAL
jgi:hypothetical protein